MINADVFSARLAARFRLDLVAASGDSRSSPYIRIDGLEPPNGFCITIVSGWRSVEAIFVPDTFASGLMKTLCSDDSQRRKEFASLAQSFAASGVKCTVRIDERQFDPAALQEGSWTKFGLSCSRLTDKAEERNEAEEVVGACLALVLSLLPVEPQSLEADSHAQGLPEGALTRITVNRYERSPSNRAAAIAAHGSLCLACGFDFAKFYGDLGEGFIEVHHQIPVSAMGESYIVSPKSDLVPLCANCHQMVHRENPPIPVEELRSRLVQLGSLPALNDLALEAQYDDKGV
jgi:5-methylcytosine-specific restriction protein A